MGVFFCKSLSVWRNLRYHWPERDGKNMNDFWKSYDITHAELGPNFRCYPLYGKIHLIELALSLVFIVGMALWYRRSSASARLSPLEFI